MSGPIAMAAAAGTIHSVEPTFKFFEVFVDERAAAAPDGRHPGLLAVVGHRAWPSAAIRESYPSWLRRRVR